MLIHWETNSADLVFTSANMFLISQGIWLGKVTEYDTSVYAWWKLLVIDYSMYKYECRPWYTWTSYIGVCHWTRLLIKILHRCSHSAWLTLLVKISLFTGWCYSSSSYFTRLDATSMFLKSFCVHEHIQLSAASVFLKSHCAWTHTVWTWLLSKMSWRHSMCLVAYHNCSWSCYSFAADHTHVLQLRDVIGHITLEKCFNLKHCHFIKWHHWCHRPKQRSSFVIDFMGQDYWTRLLAKFVVIFLHLMLLLHCRLRSSSSPTTTSTSTSIRL